MFSTVQPVQWTGLVFVLLRVYQVALRARRVVLSHLKDLYIIEKVHS
jgi:hypothetical protein